MSTQQDNTQTAIILSGLLIALGLGFFTAKQGMFGIDWSGIWPVFPGIVGASALAGAVVTEDRRLRTSLAVWGTLPLLLGLFFFAITLNLAELTWASQATLWPVYVLILGVALLAGHAASAFTSKAHLLTGVAVSVTGVALLMLTRSDVLYMLTGKRMIVVDESVLGMFASVNSAFTLWPLLVTANGVIMLALVLTGRRTHPGVAFAGTFFALLGLLFQATTLGIISWNEQQRLWPLYGVITGVALLAANFASHKASNS